VSASPDSFRPTWHFVWRHPAHWIAFGGGVGLFPHAPGTFGTLLAFPLFWWLNRHLAAFQFLGVLGLLFALGVWACGRTGRTLRVADHPGMVWDEIVAFLLVLFFTPHDLAWQAFAFLLFRVFDILKPPPIGYYDAQMKNGAGVMLDDLLAAFYALLALAAARAVLS
jgi:phosphatidylglycerophosphatase A